MTMYALKCEKLFDSCRCKALAAMASYAPPPAVPSLENERFAGPSMEGNKRGGSGTVKRMG